MNIILIGAQGSGKGTQAEVLSSKFSIPHVASGDLFRDAIKNETELGKKVQEYINQGALVPDELTIAMILDRLQQADASHGFILDGFPRTLAQAEALDKSLTSTRHSIDYVIYLNVDRSILEKRLSGRYICREHQHIYNIISHPPRVAGVCDIDGSDLYQRVDDTGETVAKRLDIFFNDTIHLVEYYRNQNKLIEVNGAEDIDKVSSIILSHLTSQAGSR